MMHFSDRLATAIHTKNSCLLLGLDPNWDKLPASIKTENPTLKQKADIFEQFCTDMVETCASRVCGVKIQMAYFEALGSVGVKAVENLIKFIRSNHTDLIIMIDAKRGDIGSTSEAYAQAFLGKDSPLAGDCVTVAPYMGTDSLEPFFNLAQKEKKGLFVLVKTSNPGSNQFQAMYVITRKFRGKLYKGVAKMLNFLASKDEVQNVPFSLTGAVVGATNIKELVEARALMPSTWILAPGVGAQGGKIEDVLKIRDEQGLGVLIPVSRSVLYAGQGVDYLAQAKAAIDQLWEAQKLS